MTITSSDNKKFVDVGSYTIWRAIYSTVICRLNESERLFPDAIDFLKIGKCAPDMAQKTARQINLIRDHLALIPPEKAVYDKDHPQLDAPWKNSISAVVTSCANLFTTADGKDLLFELVSILVYASMEKVSVETNG